MHDFILEIPNALSADVCTQIIDKFEADPRKGPGHVFGGLNLNWKRSTDLHITPLPEWSDLDARLHDSLACGVIKYHTAYPHLNACKLKDLGHQVQRTEPGEFYDWHADAGVHRNAARVYVFIWYLNDVADGGHTEMKYLGRRVKPEQGKLLLFPAAWTHYHRGEPVVSNTKYIVTGWMALTD